jgi:hypothetical protein
LLLVFSQNHVIDKVAEVLAVCNLAYRTNGFRSQVDESPRLARVQLGEHGFKSLVHDSTLALNRFSISESSLPLGALRVRFDRLL